MVRHTTGEQRRHAFLSKLQRRPSLIKSSKACTDFEVKLIPHVTSGENL